MLLSIFIFKFAEKINGMKVLNLTLKKEWFDLIKSGEKIEEYRELKDYWFDRLTVEGLDNILTSAFVFGFEIYQPRFKTFDVVKFTNGYGKNAPNFMVELDGIEIKKGNEKWGAEKGVRYFVIKLGKIINGDN